MQPCAIKPSAVVGGAACLLPRAAAGPPRLCADLVASVGPHPSQAPLPHPPQPPLAAPAPTAGAHQPGRTSPSLLLRRAEQARDAAACTISILSCRSWRAVHALYDARRSTLNHIHLTAMLTHLVRLTARLDPATSLQDPPKPPRPQPPPSPGPPAASAAPALSAVRLQLRSGDGQAARGQESQPQGGGWVGAGAQAAKRAEAAALHAFLMQLVPYVGLHLLSLGPRQLATCMWALGRLGVCPETAWLREWSGCVARKTELLSPRDLAQCAWGLVSCGAFAASPTCHPGPSGAVGLLRHLAARLTQPAVLRSAQPQDLATMLWALGAAGCLTSPQVVQGLEMAVFQHLQQAALERAARQGQGQGQQQMGLGQGQVMRAVEVCQVLGALVHLHHCPHPDTPGLLLRHFLAVSGLSPPSRPRQQSGPQPDGRPGPGPGRADTLPGASAPPQHPFTIAGLRSRHTVGAGHIRPSPGGERLGAMDLVASANPLLRRTLPSTPPPYAREMHPGGGSGAGAGAARAPGPPWPSPQAPSQGHPRQQLGAGQDMRLAGGLATPPPGGLHPGAAAAAAGAAGWNRQPEQRGQWLALLPEPPPPPAATQGGQAQAQPELPPPAFTPHSPALPQRRTAAGHAGPAGLWNDPDAPTPLQGRGVEAVRSNNLVASWQRLQGVGPREVVAVLWSLARLRHHPPPDLLDALLQGLLLQPCSASIQQPPGQQQACQVLQHPQPLPRDRRYGEQQQQEQEQQSNVTPLPVQCKHLDWMSESHSTSPPVSPHTLPNLATPQLPSSRLPSHPLPPPRPHPSPTLAPTLAPAAPRPHLQPADVAECFWALGCLRYHPPSHLLGPLLDQLPALLQATALRRARHRDACLLDLPWQAQAGVGTGRVRQPGGWRQRWRQRRLGQRRGEDQQPHPLGGSQLQARGCTEQSRTLEGRQAVRQTWESGHQIERSPSPSSSPSPPSYTAAGPALLAAPSPAGLSCQDLGRVMWGLSRLHWPPPPALRCLLQRALASAGPDLPSLAPAATVDVLTACYRLRVQPDPGTLAAVEEVMGEHLPAMDLRRLVRVLRVLAVLGGLPSQSFRAVLVARLEEVVVGQAGGLSAGQARQEGSDGPGSDLLLAQGQTMTAGGQPGGQAGSGGGRMARGAVSGPEAPRGGAAGTGSGAGLGMAPQQFVSLLWSLARLRCGPLLAATWAPGCLAAVLRAWPLLPPAGQARLCWAVSCLRLQPGDAMVAELQALPGWGRAAGRWGGEAPEDSHTASGLTSPAAPEYSRTAAALALTRQEHHP